ncbi:ABC transporter ATP-binding protein [Streptomyces physcomitrii]|uniref:ATP-binding cassette domain-containing protein n=1 Tax=Streptomyces physcomitrii TaxID=2724184 RepID=A0ABX1H0I0_9ACTN|nr:ATP-binding cassette domain-containing protein [Streptomyces physcomitrii]NKI40840.1 ATP-binding cassette domain-containing protein [Streptomyces physcomitrii]
MTADRGSAPAGPPVISVRGLSKSYGDRQVLGDVSFDVPRGRVVGLLGRNGAGKTTLMKSLLGTATVDSGSVEIFGAAPGPGHAQRVGVAMDGIGFYPAATVRRELALWATALGVPKRRIRDVIDLVELTGHERQRCAKLSTGQRQRLRLATALLVPGVELLMLDEPANGLDPDGIRWVRRFIKDMAASGKTVLVSSHQLSEMENTVDDVLLLDKGRLVHTGSLHEFTAGGRFALEDRFFEVVGGIRA